MSRKVLVLTITMIIIFAFLAPAFASTIPIIIDGKEVKSDVSPVLVQNRTMVPIRIISENLGAQVVWQNPDILIKRGDIDLKLTLKSKTAYKNGAAMPFLEVAPFLKNNRTMVPLRFIAEVLNVNISYEDGKVFISNPKIVFLTGEEIIYQDSFTIFGFKDNVPYITSVLDTRNGRPAVEFATSNNVRVGQTDGQTVYFSYHPPGTEGGLTLLYALKDGKSIIPFNTPNTLYWHVKGDYLYGVADSAGALNDISTNKAPYRGNLFRIDITKDYNEQKIEWLGSEGYHYGYEIVFTDTGQVQGVKDGELTPSIEIKEDGIYAMGVELHAANAKSTYGHYKINLEGRYHQNVGNAVE